MEIDPFSHSSPESSSDTDSEEDSSAKKKKKSKRIPLLGADISSSEKSEKQDAANDKEKKAGESAEPLWKRILGQETDKSDVAAEESENESDPENGVENNAAAAPLETLSETEQLEAAQAYVAARHAEIMHEQSHAVEGEDEAAVEERAATITLLESMRQLLGRDQGNERPSAEPVEEAYDFTVQRLGYNEYIGSHTDQEATNQVTPEPESSVGFSVRREYRQPSTHGSFSATERVIPLRPEESSTQTHEDDARRRTGSALLVGGLVGYFVGRRRGRITTEKKLKTVESKLTKQIENIQGQVVQKEQQIRRLAREAYISKDSRKQATESAPVEKAEAAPVMRREHLGLLTLKAVEAPLRPAENVENKSVQKSSVAPEKHTSVESLSRPELLAAAAEIKIGATNLKRVYETNLVGEHGLRRLIADHERGVNIRPILEKEILDKEMSYERDPRLRNSSVVGSLAASKLVRADIDKPDSNNESVTSSATDALNDTAHTSTVPKTTRPQPTAFAAVATLVVIIAVLLYILFTSR
jgi:cell division protein FtsB